MLVAKVNCWTTVVVGAAFVLAWLIAFAIGKGLADVDAEARCAREHGHWRCADFHFSHGATVTVCDCQDETGGR